MHFIVIKRKREVLDSIVAMGLMLLVSLQSLVIFKIRCGVKPLPIAR